GLPALFWLWILATPGCRPRNRTLTDRSTLCARKVLPANAFTLIRNPDPPPTAPDCTRHWIKPVKAISLSSTRSTGQMLLKLYQRVHPINKTEDSVINATYCTLSGQNPDSRSRIIALHGALNKQPLKKWDTITGRWSTRCGESRCRHDTVQRGAVGAHL